MKTLLPICIFLLSFTYAGAQITTATKMAAFGVDGDLQANYFDYFTDTDDDWFRKSGTIGNFVIDTTGAASIVSGYTSNIASRMNTFYRSMRVSPYTKISGRIWLDALFVRDYHGTDTTVFVQGSSKNGMSPGDWGGTIQAVPDKNEILDMMMHVRRNGDGISTTLNNDLWFYGGLSLESTSGQRYFDFEMYQTDIYYDRTSKKFYGYGPDAGHTSWKLDASGNITQAGDIIFSANYQSSGLTALEARIWVDKATMNTTPAGFQWSGTFDGASNGSQYGYAGISPKVAGDFYIGLENSKSVWAGPFKLVRTDNSVVDNYDVGQFMEFSVNLTKLGLDPVTLGGRDFCGVPFNRLVVKTRASESFTSALKDFVAPVDLFLAPRADAVTDVPLYCGVMGVSQLKVVNPSASSVYTWSTSNGNIVGSTSGSSVYADAPGTYIVQQQLAAGCNPYAYDTLQIVYDANCTTLKTASINLQASLKGEIPQISWTSFTNNNVQYYELERSYDGNTFALVKRVDNQNPEASKQSYLFKDVQLESNEVYYRVKVITTSGVYYSRVINVHSNSKLNVVFAPNPASDHLRISFIAEQNQKVQLTIFGLGGNLVYEKSFFAAPGANSLTCAKRR
jgi:hypothetical protein